MTSRYDFDRQIGYEAEEPLRVHAGTRLRATGWLHGSEGNLHHPDPGAKVGFGEQAETR